MLTVTKTADDDTYQTFSLPAATSGTVFVRVVDTNRARNESTLDSIYVDEIFFRSEWVAALGHRLVVAVLVQGALNAPEILRRFPLIGTSCKAIPMPQDTFLLGCPEIGVHYKIPKDDDPGYPTQGRHVGNLGSLSRQLS